MFPQGYPWIPLINFSQFGPAVWPAYSYYIYKQAWKSSAAQVSKSYSLRLPAFERFYRETEFSLIKVDPLNLESQNQEHSRGSSEFPNQNLRQIGHSFPVLWSDNQTENRDYNFIHIDDGSKIKSSSLHKCIFLSDYVMICYREKRVHSCMELWI